MDHYHPFCTDWLPMLARLRLCINKILCYPFVFSPKVNDRAAATNYGTNMDTVKPKWNSTNFIKTLQAKQGWWMGEGNQRQTALRTQQTRHFRIHIWMQQIRILAKPFIVFTTLSKTKNPVQHLLNYSICRSKTALQEVFIQPIVISLPIHYLANAQSVWLSLFILCN